MAVVAVKTTSITNLDASPSLRSQAWTHGGAAKNYAGTVEAANGDSIASTYRFFRVWSGWRPISLNLFCDAITSGAGDVGLYRVAADGGAVVDADFFASAQSIATAITLGTNIRFEAGAGTTGDVANIEKRIWEMLGLTSDPVLEYDIVMTLTAATTAAGTISLNGSFAH